MKKILAIIGSPRKGATFRAVRSFEKMLNSRLPVDVEYVFLRDYNIQQCRGCIRCFDDGEQHCPLKDDRDLLIQKMESADGVLFTTPNYSFHVSGTIKVFIDRLAFIFHRPRFFGKPAAAIVMQGIMGGKKTHAYLHNITSKWGFSPVRGAVLTALNPPADKAGARIDRQLGRLADRFARALARPALPNPTLYRLMMFRMQRTGMKNLQDDAFEDFRFFRDRGWFESDYFYPVRLNPFQRLAGAFFDRLGALFFQA